MPSQNDLHRPRKSYSEPCHCNFSACRTEHRGRVLSSTHASVSVCSYTLSRQDHPFKMPFPFLEEVVRVAQEPSASNALRARLWQHGLPAVHGNDRCAQGGTNDNNKRYNTWPHLHVFRKQQVLRKSFRHVWPRKGRSVSLPFYPPFAMSLRKAGSNSLATVGLMLERPKKRCSALRVLKYYPQ